MSIEDKMNEFAPGLVEGQVEFYRVTDDGAVERWWIVPGTFGPTSHGPADWHPCGEGPRPGWYDVDGKALPGDPREAAQ